MGSFGLFTPRSMNVLLVALFATAAFAVAMPNDLDTIDDDNHDSFLQMQELVTNQGANACLSLAKATEDEVKKNVQALQDALDQIDKGENCPSKGSSAVNEATKAKVEAQTSLTAANKAKKDADEEMLQFPTYQADSLDGSTCSSFYNSQVWKTSKAKRDAASKAADKAKGALAEASQALDAAVIAAKKAVTSCQCNVRRLHATSLKKANADAVKANTKAWTKAAHLRCVIEGKTTNQCTVPDVPKVKKVSVKDGVKNANCNPEKLEVDKCNGVRYCSPSTDGQKMLYQTYQYATWDQSRKYICPDGFYWASSSQYRAAISRIGQCFGGGYTMHNACGWNGYAAPSGTSHTYYRFADSPSSSCYQNVGSYTGMNCGGDRSTSGFAGVVCLKRGWTNVGGNTNPNQKTWGYANPTTCSLDYRKC